MKIRPTVIFSAISVLLAYTLNANVSPASAAGAISLGSASNFAILAGGGITNSGTTIVSGDIGTYPSISYVGSGTVSQTGVNHLGDSVTQTAKSDLLTAFNAAGTEPATATMTGDLGGLTLGPGVYKGNTSNYTITINGALTLDGGNDPNAVFIFRGTKLTTLDATSQIKLINGANPCNIFWKITYLPGGSWVNIGPGTLFRGTILSEQDITLKPNASVLGRLFSTNGKITIEKNYIYKPTCGTPPTPTPSPTPSPTTTSTSACTTMLCPSPTATPTPKPSVTPTQTSTPTFSPTPTPKPSVTPTPTATLTPSPSPSSTPTEPQIPIKPIGFVATGGGSPLIFSPAVAQARLMRPAPLSISIPAIGVKAKIVTLGFDSEGGMEVPTTGAVTGWFNGAPTPGELGPAIIVGHVDWNGKIAVFYKIKNLKKGNLIKVLRSDGKQITYSVTRVLTVDKLKFPTELVYGDIDHVGLRLITCGGRFDSKLKRHINNIIVFARAVQ
jgi:hypothetical protein